MCSTYANGTRIETTNVTKFCDDPTPGGGDLCHCNATDPNEHSCDGMVARIDHPCKKGNLTEQLSHVVKLKLFIKIPHGQTKMPHYSKSTCISNNFLG